MTFSAPEADSDLLRNTNQNFLDYNTGEFKRPYFKHISPSTVIATKL